MKEGKILHDFLKSRKGLSGDEFAEKLGMVRSTLYEHFEDEILKEPYRTNAIEIYGIQFPDSENKEEEAFQEGMLVLENKDLKIKVYSLEEKIKIMEDREEVYKTEIERLKKKGQNENPEQK